jgi:CIC family chloride channel protein
LRERLEALRRRFTRMPAVGEEQAFLLVAVFVGVVAALAVVCFRIAIESARLILLGSSLHPSPLRLVLAPTLVGLLVGALVQRFFTQARGSGVNQTKAALYVDDGYIPFRTVAGKFVTSSLAIGSGQSLGPEDPSLQIGAGFASAIGRVLALPREKLRLLPSLGAAGGLAAAFNSPIAAVLFVVEEVIGRWSAGVLGAVILSAVAGVSVAQWFLGADPLFRVPAVYPVDPRELVAFAGLGLAGGLAAVCFLRLALGARRRLAALPTWTGYFQPAVAGAAIGCVALAYPQVLGAGYETIDAALRGEFSWRTLAILGVLKIACTGLSFATGTPGGLFAPTLVMGALVGGAVGRIQALWFPDLASPLGLYVLVGMGTMFAGNLRAPMTSIFMILEITGNYTIVVPLLVSNTLAYLVSLKFQRTPIFDVVARMDGMDLPSTEEQREQAVLRVEHAMRAPEDTVLKPGELVSEALRRAGSTAGEFLLVHEQGRGWSGITRDRLLRAADDSAPDVKVGELAEAVLPQLHPDHPLESALRLVREWWPLLPVVHRADSSRLLGVVSLDDILATYRGGQVVRRLRGEER